MNFQTLHNQRKFVAIAALLGIISVFLPWIKMFMFTVNGFHGWGILVFFCLLLSLILALVGNHTESISKTNWIIILSAGLLSILILVIAMMQVSDVNKATGGLMDMADDYFGESKRSRRKSSNGLQYGIWITLISSLGVIVAAWFFKSADTNLKDSFDSLKSSVSAGVSNATANVGQGKSVGKNKLEELEKLYDMKNKGIISEEEFNNLKSRYL